MDMMDIHGQMCNTYLRMIIANVQYSGRYLGLCDDRMGDYFEWNGNGRNCCNVKVNLGLIEF